MSQHFAMFGVPWFSASGDIKHLICQMISKNHVIQRSSNFMIESFLWYVTTLHGIPQVWWP